MALQLLLLCLILCANVEYLNGNLNQDDSKVTTLTKEDITRENVDSEEILDPDNDDVGVIDDVDLRKFYVNSKWNNPDQAFSPCKHSIILENILIRVLDFMGLGGNFEPKVQIKEILNDAESYINNVPLQYQDSQLVAKLNKLITYFDPKLAERFLRTGDTKNEEKKEDTTRTRVVFKEKLPKIEEPKCKKAFLNLIRDVHRKYKKLAKNSCDSDLAEDEEVSNDTSKPARTIPECALNPAYGLLLLQLRPFIIDSPYANNIFQQLGWLLSDGNNINYLNSELTQAQLFALLQNIQDYRLLQNQNAFIQLPLGSLQYQSLVGRLGGINQVSQPWLYQNHQNPYTKFYKNNDLTKVSNKFNLPSHNNYEKNLLWFLQQNPEHGKFSHISTDGPESTNFKSVPSQNINNDKMTFLREEEYNPNDGEHLHSVPNSFSMNILHKNTFQPDKHDKTPLSQETNRNEEPNVKKLSPFRGKLPQTLLTYIHSIFPDNKHQESDEYKKANTISVSARPKNTIATESVNPELIKTVQSSVEQNLLPDQEQLPAHINEFHNKLANFPKDISTDQPNGDHTIEFSGYDSLISESKEPENIVDIIHDVIPQQQQSEIDVDQNAILSDEGHIKHQHSGEFQSNGTNISHKQSQPIKSLLDTDDAYKTHYVSFDKSVNDYLKGSEDQNNGTQIDFIQPELFEFEPKKYDTKPNTLLSKIDVSDRNTSLPKPTVNHGSDLLKDYGPDYDPDSYETLNRLKPQEYDSAKASSNLNKAPPKKEMLWNPKSQETEESDVEDYSLPGHKTVLTKISEIHSNPANNFGFKEHKPDAHYYSRPDSNYIHTGEVENKFFSYKNQNRPKTLGISLQHNVDNQGLNKEQIQNLYIQTVKVKPRISKWKTNKYVQFQQEGPIKWNLEEEKLQPSMWEKADDLSPTVSNYGPITKKTKVVTKWKQYNAKKKPIYFSQESEEYETETPHKIRWEKYTNPIKLKNEEYFDSNPVKLNLTKYKTKWKTGSFKGQDREPTEWNQYVKTKPKVKSTKLKEEVILNWNDLIHPSPSDGEEVKSPKLKEEVILNWNDLIHPSPNDGKEVKSPKLKEKVILNWNDLIHPSSSDREGITVSTPLLDNKNIDGSSNKLFTKHDDYINSLEPTSNNDDYSGTDVDQDVLNNSGRSELIKNKHKGTHVTEDSYYDYNNVRGEDFFKNNMKIKGASQVNSKKPLLTDKSVLWQETSLPEGQFLAEGYNVGLNSNNEGNINQEEGTDYITALLKKLEHNPGDAELSYVIKVAPPVFRPYYYITYTIPFQAFIKNIEDLLRKHPSLSSNLDKLFQELINVSNITTVSPALKNLPKEDLSALALQDGKVSLINAKLSNQVEKIFLRSNETENKAARVEQLVDGLNKLIREFSSDDNVKLQKVVGFLDKDVIPLNKEQEKKAQRVQDINVSINSNINKDSLGGKKPNLTVLGISKRSSGESVDITKEVDNTTTESNKYILTTAKN